MKNIQVLDCTLRDGGYINDFEFGKRNIKEIIAKLNNCKTDIVEVGFLSNVMYDVNKTLFPSVNDINTFLPSDRHSLFVAMIALGKNEVSIDSIPYRDESNIDGIRITFHKHEIDKALTYAQAIKERGYKVFFQPVGTIGYSTRELLDLIRIVNDLHPYAFYLVDTLGTIDQTLLTKMFNLVDSCLDDGICIGFHAHNNLQLAFANAIQLLSINTDRHVIVDSTVYGMGRGAGNLCTELILEYLNVNFAKEYDFIYALKIIDENLNEFIARFKWGYTAPYFLSAISMCHPDYATYLINKQTLSIEIIHELLSRIPKDKRFLYNKGVIDDIYIQYQTRNNITNTSINKLNESLAHRTVLLIAPGKSTYENIDRINAFIKDTSPIVISINFIPDGVDIDYAFISNFKRFNDVVYLGDESKIFITSNIESKKNYNVLDYKSLLLDFTELSDNAGLMCMNMIAGCDADRIVLAGFDGIKAEVQSNYVNSSMITNTDMIDVEAYNKKFSLAISQIDKKIPLEFLTPSIYEGQDE